MRSAGFRTTRPQMRVSRFQFSLRGISHFLSPAFADADAEVAYRYSTAAGPRVYAGSCLIGTVHVALVLGWLPWDSMSRDWLLPLIYANAGALGVSWLALPMLCRWQARRRHIDWFFLLQGTAYTLLANLWPRALDDDEELWEWWDAGVQQLAVALLSYYSVFGHMRLGLYLLLLHLVVGACVVAHLVCEQLEPADVPRRLLRLYLALLLLYVGARKSDAHLRREFSLRHSLQHRHNKSVVEIEQLRHSLIVQQASDTKRRSVPWVPEATVVLLRSELDALSCDERKGLVLAEELVDMDEVLGAGSFAQVRLGELRGHTPVAVKRLHAHHLDREGVRRFRAECALLLSLRHPNVIQCSGLLIAPGQGHIAMVLELCTRGPLDELLSGPRARHLTWREHKLGIALGVARALAYLHGQSPLVMHRDLKPSNILVDDGFNAKISDFGTSRAEEVADMTMTLVGTPLFAAPEVMRHERYNEKADVWSFGCVLETIWTHRRVYAASNVAISNVVRMVAEGTLCPRVPETCFLAPLVASCVQADSAERPSSARIVELLSDTQLAAAACFLPPGPGDGPLGPANSVSSSKYQGLSSVRDTTDIDSADASPRSSCVGTRHSLEPRGRTGTRGTSVVGRGSGGRSVSASPSPGTGAAGGGSALAAPPCTGRAAPLSTERSGRERASTQSSVVSCSSCRRLASSFRRASAGKSSRPRAKSSTASVPRSPPLTSSLSTSNSKSNSFDGDQSLESTSATISTLRSGSSVKFSGAHQPGTLLTGIRSSGDIESEDVATRSSAQPSQMGPFRKEMSTVLDVDEAASDTATPTPRHQPKDERSRKSPAI